MDKTKEVRKCVQGVHQNVTSVNSLGIPQAGTWSPEMRVGLDINRQLLLLKSNCSRHAQTEHMRSSQLS
jgi:hypothetical protein